MNMIPMSRSDVDNLRRDECLQLMEQLGVAQPRRGVLMELKAIIEDLLFSQEDGPEQPLLGLAKNEQVSTGGQGPTADYSNNREPHEETLVSAHKGKPHAAVDTSGIGLSGIRQAWIQDVQDVSGGPEVGSRILPMC